MHKIIKVFIAAGIIFCVILIAGGLYLRAHYIGPVLMYHYVVDTSQAKKDKRIIKPRSLEQQLRFLKENQYNVIGIDEYAKLLRENQFIPRNTVVITFDDGHLDNYTHAYPLLKKYNLPAVMYVIVDKISQPNHMTREQLIEMSDSGLITIGSHGLRGEHLPSMQEDQYRKEIYDSKKKLEAILQKPVESFSYPIGGFNEQIRRMVIDAGYRCAVATSPGVDYPNNDIFAIKRIRISESSSNLFVFWFETSGLYKYILEKRKAYEIKRKKLQPGAADDEE